jgi:hypothetical protein
VLTNNGYKNIGEILRLIKMVPEEILDKLGPLIKPILKDAKTLEKVIKLLFITEKDKDQVISTISHHSELISRHEIGSNIKTYGMGMAPFFISISL